MSGIKRHNVNLPDEPGKRCLTIRCRLLFSVNATLAVLLAAFLIYEYNRTLNARLAEKHSSLKEEAVTVAEGVAALRHHGRKAIQNYIDEVCHRMQEASSPGHHLVIKLGETILQAQSHNRASKKIVEAMQSARAPNFRASFGKRELVVGNDRRDNLSVYVSEYAGDIRQSVFAGIVRHLLALSLGGGIAAIIVNLVLYRTVDKPLRGLSKTVTEIGQGQLGLQAKSFKIAEFASLADAINSMSRSLAEAERIRNSQIRKARKIQENLLPQEMDIPGLRLATLYRPADEVSGDYYDLFRLPDGSWLVCIADVVGHGIPAAMTAAMLKMLLLQATRYHTDPSAILGHVNEQLSEVSLAGDFASMGLARWHPKEQRLQYASAGHGSVRLVSRDGTCHELLSTGLLLGIEASASWHTAEIDVVPGDRLVLATDGVSETVNPSGILFGNERITRILSEHDELPLEYQVQHIENELNEHRKALTQKDDITLILIEFMAAYVEASDSGQKKAASC